MDIFSVAADSLSETRMRELVESLRNAGLGNYVELPQIVVCGATSTGKSSLLSAISGIPFPKDAKLTTRCPTQVIMETQDCDTRITVHVRFVGEKPTQANEVQRLETKTELMQDQVEQTISDVSSQLMEMRKKPIFSDTIVIEVQARHTPNLTLIDLPGLVSNLNEGDPETLIDDVRKLVKDYAIQERTVILAVVSCADDIRNAGILQLSKELDPAGIRTLGVLTKPDKVDKGDKKELLNIFCNQVNVLKLGWHMVRTRRTEEMNQNSEQFLFKEDRFFNDDADFSRDEKLLDRTGIKNLRILLKRLLMERIRHSLPSIEEEIMKRRKDVQDELTRLGEPLDTPGACRNMYTRIYQSFNKLVINAVEGDYHLPFFHDGEHRRVRAVCRKYEEKLKQVLSEERVLHEGCEYRVGDQILDASGAVVEIEGVTESSDGIRMYDLIDGTRVDSKMAIHDRSEIKKIIASHRGCELPGFISYPVFCSLIAPRIQSWRAPASQLMKDSMHALLKTSMEIIEFTCNGLPSIHMKAHLQKKITNLLDRLRLGLDSALDAELGEFGEGFPHTMNERYIQELERLRTQPLEAALESAFEGKRASFDVIIAVLHKFGVGSVSNEDSDAIDMEFHMAAYITVARERFADNAQKLLQLNLFGPFVKELEKMFAATDEQIGNIIFEEASVKIRRRNLLRQQEIYTESERILQMFGL